MKWVTAAITFVNLSVVCGLFLGIAGKGLNAVTAALALVCGAAFAVASFLGTRDTGFREKAADGPATEQKSLKASASEETQNSLPSALMRYRRVWFWAVAFCFAIFAVRSFCWLLYIDSSELKIQSPNNLGDLSLHLTLIKSFANGVALWPDNPIFAFSNLRYPAGIDLFNGLLSLVHIDLLVGLVWVGLVASLSIFYGFYRWGGTFAVAGFLFNGGIAGFQFLKTFKFLDYQGTAADIAHKPIAWKSIALSMLVTQRGWLYAIPAGLVLLWHWREKFFSQSPEAEAGSSAAAWRRRMTRASPVKALRVNQTPSTPAATGKVPCPGGLNFRFTRRCRCFTCILLSRSRLCWLWDYSSNAQPSSNLSSISFAKTGWRALAA